MIKIDFNCIVFNGDMFLSQVLESIYDVANRIFVCAGPVRYWQNQGLSTSTDDTNEILKSFPDPKGKLTVLHRKFEEKNEQCNALSDKWDGQYIFGIDADELYTPEDLEKIIKTLETGRYTDVSMKSKTFFGGFDRILGGFEAGADFRRIHKIEPYSKFLTHRPPTMLRPSMGMRQNWLSSDEIGVFIKHFSYVSPSQTKMKMQYYEAAVINKGECIPNYFNDVWLRWARGSAEERDKVEDQYNGVHEFSPHVRGECRTMAFDGPRPPIIERDMTKLIEKFNKQLNMLS